MGCYDSFYVMAECPHCTAIHQFEFQTKALGATMSAWVEGDEFNSQDTRHINMLITKGSIKSVYGGCNSAKCKAWQTKRDGYCGGFGRRVWADIEIKNGKVIGSVNVRKKE
jgi:hypothetical protein